MRPDAATINARRFYLSRGKCCHSIGDLAYLDLSRTVVEACQIAKFPKYIKLLPNYIYLHISTNIKEPKYSCTAAFNFQTESENVSGLSKHTEQPF